MIMSTSAGDPYILLKHIPKGGGMGGDNGDLSPLLLIETENENE